MSQLHRLELMGCTPEPLIAYLKALGIFRLVAKQKDNDARAWWQADTFFLRSTLDRDAMVEFFLQNYRPTPIASPWNSRYRTGVVKGDKSGLDASGGPHHQDSGEAKIRESTAGVSRKPSSDGKARGCSSKHLCGLTAWNT